MIELAGTWVWVVVGVGGLLALLSLILAIALGFMLNGPISRSDEADELTQAEVGRATSEQFG